MTDTIFGAWHSLNLNPNTILLTIITEWHNLINNPVDLPNENDSCMIALLKDDSVSIDYGPYGYSDTKMSFYTDDDEYGRLYCDEEFLKHYGRIVAWAISPAFEKMEPALNKLLLGKEVTKNV